MTKTPVRDFVKKYARKRPVRLHVPGHKGKRFIGLEKFDVTEIDGADELYNSNGVILESELIASDLFNCHTFYSTEGSSLAIRAMVYLTCLFAKSKGQKPYFLATRNAHKSFLTAICLTGAKLGWIYNDCSPFLTSDLTACKLENLLKNSSEIPTALYLTSPDYLGRLLDLKSISEICKKYGILLLVDCAHGSYLKFLKNSLFPIDLGADMCASSAHKTLPCLTGGAYLHLSNRLDESLILSAKKALSVFGSTSPSYLILQSLDNCNKVVKKGFTTKLNSVVLSVNLLKDALREKGFTVYGNEPLKICFDGKKLGYTGERLKDVLLSKGIYIEFYDRDFVVLMFSPYIKKSKILKIKRLLCSLPKLSP
ncbi:MAG: aminotransferase class V-fold PLP-dependent enzyme, partial [Clostridia bacterium]|nr:aminotransferase class V-fold PLP-dependent enzyme [Clostridia bacterium]